MEFDKTIKIRLGESQKLKLGALSEGLEGGMSERVRAWIDEAEVSKVVFVTKDVEKASLAPSFGGSKFSPAELQAMADRVKAKTSGKKSRDSQAS